MNVTLRLVVSRSSQFSVIMHMVWTKQLKANYTTISEDNLTGFQAVATDPEGDSPLTWKLISGNRINNYDVFVMNSSGWVSIN